MDFEEAPASLAVFAELEAFWPGQDEFIKVAVTSQKARAVARFEPAHRTFELRNIVPWTLLNPVAIFPYSSESYAGYCFSSLPTMAFDDKGRRLGPPEDMVYLVFLNTRFRVTDWGWEDEDLIASGWPKNRRGRLSEPLWTKDGY